MLENAQLPTIYVTARDRSRLEMLLAARHRFIPDAA
jgi:hypothetical protein